MLLIPAVDIKDGKRVRLSQGKLDTAVIYEDDPVVAALKWQELGAQYLHVVDLDGAFSGKTVNYNSIKRILETIKIPVEIGGGIRTLENIKKYLDNGADRVILGTKAVTDPALLTTAISSYKEKIAVGIDASHNKVVIEGWAQESTITSLDLAAKVKELGIQTIIYTDIATDGMLKGPNITGIETFAKTIGVNLIASGGISTVADINNIKKLESLGVCGMIVGKALYTGKLNFEEAQSATLSD